MMAGAGASVGVWWQHEVAGWPARAAPLRTGLLGSEPAGVLQAGLGQWCLVVLAGLLLASLRTTLRVCTRTGLAWSSLGSLGWPTPFMVGSAFPTLLSWLPPFACLFARPMEPPKWSRNPLVPRPLLTGLPMHESAQQFAAAGVCSPVCPCMNLPNSVLLLECAHRSAHAWTYPTACCCWCVLSAWLLCSAPA